MGGGKKEKGEERGEKKVGKKKKKEKIEGKCGNTAQPHNKQYQFMVFNHCTIVLFRVSGAIVL